MDARHIWCVCHRSDARLLPQQLQAPDGTPAPVPAVIHMPKRQQTLAAGQRLDPELSMSLTP